MADGDQEVKFCSNCKKDISANNFVMHEVHCRRHIALCTHCQEPIPKGELDQHFQDEHATVPCTKCRQNVEKRSLEKHEENDCPQRPQHCLYCEIEVPKSDLASHLDYCGSRTEQCLKCFQFIMLKDQLRHDEIDCRHQQPSTANGTGVNFLNNANGLDVTGFVDNTQYSRLRYDIGDPGEDNLNPFMFDEMSRLLNNQEERSPFYSDAASELFTNQAAQSNIQRRNEITQPKRNNVEPGRRQLNLSPPETSETTTSPSHTAEDYDYLLALHLATDLDPSEDSHVEGTVNNFVDLSSPDRLHGYNSNTQTEINVDDVARDFWRDAFSTDPVNQFQPDADSPPSHNTELPDHSPPISSLNSDINSSRGIPANQTPPDIPILDNLSYGAAQNWLSADEGMEREGTMLPCEFCGALLPMEFIVQHQGVCDADPAFQATIIQSPPTQPKKKTSNVLPREKKSNVTATSSMPRSHPRQADPVTSLSNTRRTNLDDSTTQRFTKNINSNNLSESSIGANGVANIKAMLNKNKPRAGIKSNLGTPNPRHQLPQNSTNQRAVQRGPRSDDLQDSDSSLDDELGLLGSSRNQISTKAVKQNDNRARQTASRQVRGSTRHTTGRGLGEVSRGSSGLGPALSIRPLGESRGEGAAAASSTRQPRRSGNQVFSGPAKRTSKRQLPDRPS